MVCQCDIDALVQLGIQDFLGFGDNVLRKLHMFQGDIFQNFLELSGNRLIFDAENLFNPALVNGIAHMSLESDSLAHDNHFLLPVIKS